MKKNNKIVIKIIVIVALVALLGMEIAPFLSMAKW